MSSAYTHWYWGASGEEQRFPAARRGRCCGGGAAPPARGAMVVGTVLEGREARLKSRTTQDITKIHSTFTG